MLFRVAVERQGVGGGEDDEGQEAAAEEVGDDDGLPTGGQCGNGGVVGEDGPGNGKAEGDGADAEHVDGGVDRRGQPVAGTKSIKGQCADDGDDGGIDRLEPLLRVGLARERGDAEGPEGDFDAEVKGEEHADGVAVEDGLADRQGEVAVILDAGHVGEGAADVFVAKPEKLRAYDANSEPEGDAEESEDRRKKEILRMIEDGVTDDDVPGEAGTSSLTMTPRRDSSACWLRTRGLAETEARCHEQEDGGDEREQERVSCTAIY